MTLFLSIIGTLVVLALWTLAWRNRPILAFGIFLGAASVWLIASIFRPQGIYQGLHHIPLWLPALPFTVVAVVLFYFGTLAWLWGRRKQS